MKNADLEEIIGKPDYHIIVNSGIYILEPEVISLVSKNKATDMPNLIVLAKKKVFNVQVYLPNCPGLMQRDEMDIKRHWNIWRDKKNKIVLSSFKINIENKTLI